MRQGEALHVEAGGGNHAASTAASVPSFWHGEEDDYAHLVGWAGWINKLGQMARGSPFLFLCSFLFLLFCFALGKKIAEHFIKYPKLLCGLKI